MEKHQLKQENDKLDFGVLSSSIDRKMSRKMSRDDFSVAKDEDFLSKKGAKFAYSPADQNEFDPPDVIRQSSRRDTLHKSYSDIPLPQEKFEHEIASDNASANDDKKNGNNDAKKFISEAAEKLEAKLIEQEFYKNYNVSVIYFIFIMLFLSNVFINVDHGSLPGCSDQIKKDLNMNNFEFGILGSVVYGGLTVGAGVATGAYSKGSWIKPSLVGTLAFNAIAVWVFTLTDSFYINAFLRFWIGFFQVFCCIFTPVWADAYAREN